MSSTTSCRPGVMPSTKTYVVRRLDSTEQEVTLLKKATGGDCLDRVRDLQVFQISYTCIILGLLNTFVHYVTTFCTSHMI